MVWYIHCSWLENAGTWFSKFTVVAQTTWFGIPDVCNVKGVSVCVCVCVCVCVGGWVGGWVGVCVCYGIEDHDVCDSKIIFT